MDFLYRSNKGIIAIKKSTFEHVKERESKCKCMINYVCKNIIDTCILKD